MRARVGEQLDRPASKTDAFRSALLGAAAILVFALFRCWLDQTRFNDFIEEAWVPLRQLYGLHIHAAIATGPGYIGSLLLRAPFAAIGLALHGDWQMVYFTTAVPCVVAVPLLVWWLQPRLDSPDGTSQRFWIYVSPLCLLLPLNPVLWYDLFLGHPEELLGATLVVAGVVQAGRARAEWSMLLLGLAVDNKSWAIVAVPVALGILPRRHLRALLVLGLTVSVVTVPVLVMKGGGATALSGGTGAIFLFPQLWWWFGWHNWPVAHAHYIIIGVAFGCSASWWLIRGRCLLADESRAREGLALLALVLLLRSALDPWNQIYYQLPFLLTVYALELGRPPKASVGLTLVLASVTLPLHLYSLDVRAATYQAVVIPIILTFAVRVYAPGRWAGAAQSLAMLDSIRGRLQSAKSMSGS